MPTNNRVSPPVDEQVKVRDNRRHSFFTIDNELIRNFGEVIGAYGIALYAVLASMADNETQECKPKQSTIARLCGLGRTKVNEVLQELKNQGLIDIEESYNSMGFRIRSVYTLLDIKGKTPQPTLKEQKEKGLSRTAAVHVANNGCSRGEQHELDSLELDSDSKSLSSYEDNESPRPAALPTQGLQEEISEPGPDLEEIAKSQTSTIPVQPTDSYLPPYEGLGTFESPAVFKGERLVTLPPHQPLDPNSLAGLSSKARSQAELDFYRTVAREQLQILDRCANASPKIKPVWTLPDSPTDPMPHKVTSDVVLLAYIEGIFGQSSVPKPNMELNMMIKNLRSPWLVYEAIGKAATQDVKSEVFHYLWGIVRAEMARRDLKPLPAKPAGKAETAEIKRLKALVNLPASMNYITYLDYQQRLLEACEYSDNWGSFTREGLTECIEALKRLVEFYGGDKAA
jgi:biotin operon repressor